MSHTCKICGGEHRPNQPVYLLDCYQRGYARLQREVAAAEERGRRAGIEEERERWKYSQRVIAILVQRLDNIALISKAEQERLDPRIVIETVVKHDGSLMIRLARDLSESALAGDKAESALAPRDSGKETVTPYAIPGDRK